MHNKNKFLATVFLLIFSSYIYTMVPNTVVATVPVGVNPTSIAISPDNSVAYVVNSNSFGIAGQNSVSVIDLNTGLPSATITDPSFNSPFTVTLNPQGTLAYVTNSGGSTVSIIDTATNTVTGTISGFNGPSGLVISPNGRFAYVNNYGLTGNGNTVSVVDLSTNTIVGSPITVGQAPAAIAISPDGSFVYTVNYVNGNPNTGTLSVIRTSDNTVTNTITGFSGPFDIAISPNGRRAYVTNFGSNNFAPFGTTVSVVDLNTNSIINTIDVGIQPAGIALSPDGRFAYVTNYNTLYAGPNFTNLTPGQGTVSIIDTRTNQVVAPTIPVGDSPANIEISPNGDFALVSNFSSNTVDVVTLQTFQITAQGCKIKKHSKTVANKLTWQVSGSSLPVSYSIYRDAMLTDLVVTLSAAHTHYVDKDIESGKKYTYYIVGINDAGVTSEPVAIPVTKTCNS